MGPLVRKFLRFRCLARASRSWGWLAHKTSRIIQMGISRVTPRFSLWGPRPSTRLGSDLLTVGGRQEWLAWTAGDSGACYFIANGGTA